MIGVQRHWAGREIKVYDLDGKALQWQADCRKLAPMCVLAARGGTGCSWRQASRCMRCMLK